MPDVWGHKKMFKTLSVTSVKLQFGVGGGLATNTNVTAITKL